MAFARNIYRKLGGLDLTLSATWGAAEEIRGRFADPLAIGREAELIGVMQKAMIPYTPKFSLDVVNIPAIIHIGVKAAGGSHTLERIKDACFEAGYQASSGVVAEYLFEIIGPAPQEKIDDEKAPRPGE